MLRTQLDASCATRDFWIDRASQKLDAAGTRNTEWTLIPRLRQLGQLNVKRRFLMLRTQFDASCATRGKLSW